MRFSASLAALLMAANLSHAEWKPAPVALMTEWAAKVEPAQPLPEYPRPQLVREQWTNLNGLWDYAITARDAARPTDFQGQILVPFCVESSLSGVGKRVSPVESLWYRRTFATPAAKAGERTILHFGGVDWQAHVYVNGILVAKHEGGHTPFSADITTALKSSGDNELVVKVWDPTDAGSQPRGKQERNPNGIWYTPVTGIWQTVWTETVPAQSIEKLKLTPTNDGNSVQLVTTVAGSGDTFEVEAIVSEGGQQVATLTGPSGGTLTITPQNPKKWSPDSPFLYDLTVNLKKDGKTVDTVKSYFALRTVGRMKDAAGYERLTLNGQPLFMFGPLDQGWWPDGLYTAPTDEALKWDIEFTKRLGFNMARKHIKVEPARWYYWCDKLGLMVWQDQSSGMGEGRNQGVRGGSPNDAVFTPIEKVQFIAELTEMLDTLHNSPSVVCWIPFNEGWGQHDTNDVLKWVKAYDPTRLVDGPTGWEDRGWGDMHDMHNYPGPGMFPTQEGRASVLGEYGGLGLPVEGHLWQNNKNWGYRSYNDKEGLGKAYTVIAERMIPLVKRGLAAAVYTQTTDVEGEVNGFATYDRKVIKYDLTALSELHARVIKSMSEPVTVQAIVPTSLDAPQTYQYTFETPKDGWQKPDFDASSWKTGQGQIGHGQAPRVQARTDWSTPDVWVRREITLESIPQGDLFLNVAHDDGFELFINGVPAAKANGADSNYPHFTLSSEARAALKPGKNVIAIHCHDDGGESVIDFGLGEYKPAK
ncbi:MAG: glycoside hydrolase family 2 TIM barrel-domain containing protein [Tepidisphaeraceae bacterium]